MLFMRGNLLKNDTASFIVAVEYIIDESGHFYEGGLSEWEGTFIPELSLTLSGDAFILELEDGRRGRILIMQRRVIPDQPTLFRFRGRAGVGP